MKKITALQRHPLVIACALAAAGAVLFVSEASYWRSTTTLQELTEMGKIQSRKEWDEIQVKFLNQHQYFTQTAIQSRQKKKAANLQVVVERLAADAYQD
mgnify:CR=1 FL=1